MALEDGPASPEALAARIHRQLGPSTGPIGVHAIARALDIEEIREEELRTFEGALVTDRERSRGRILLNATSPRGSAPAHAGASPWRTSSDIF